MKKHHQWCSTVEYNLNRVVILICFKSVLFYVHGRRHQMSSSRAPRDCTEGWSMHRGSSDITASNGIPYIECITYPFITKFEQCQSEKKNYPLLKTLHRRGPLDTLDVRITSPFITKFELCQSEKKNYPLLKTLHRRGPCLSKWLLMMLHGVTIGEFYDWMKTRIWEWCSVFMVLAVIDGRTHILGAISIFRSTCHSNSYRPANTSNGYKKVQAWLFLDLQSKQPTDRDSLNKMKV